MRKILTWLKQSNRYKHLIGGLLIGAFADSDYCAAYAGVGVAASLEYKDKAHGCEWDWTDFSITVLGVVIGRLSITMII